MPLYAKYIASKRKRLKRQPKSVPKRKDYSALAKVLNFIEMMLEMGRRGKF